MKLPFYIARRYLFAKKKNNLINFITKISVVVIAITTAALILVLSVMNGMTELVNQLYSNFSPDLVITANEGKTFSLEDVPVSSLEKVEGVEHVMPSFETMVLLKYREQQEVAKLKGVENQYFEQSGLSEHMNFSGYVSDGDYEYSVLGLGLAYRLGVPHNINTTISIYAPGDPQGSVLSTKTYFRNKPIENIGVFSVSDEFDKKFMLCSNRFVQSLTDNNGYSRIEIRTNPNIPLKKTQSKIQELTGKDFIVKNRFEQHEFLFKSINAEKWVALLVLAFIMLIAFFNLTGSLIMLMIDKKEDVFVLHSMGMSKSVIKRIFFTEGILITLLGACIGVALGTSLVFLQEYFAIVKIKGAFVVSAYPVDWQILDALIVMVLVVSIGSIASFIPSRKLYLKKV